MNPYLRKTRGPDNWSVSLPQQFGGTLWVLRLATMGKMIRFSVFDANPRNPTPVHATFKLVPLSDIERLCLSMKTHDRLVIKSGDSAELILIANRVDNCYSGDILALFRCDTLSDIKLTLGRGWFSQK